MKKLSVLIGDDHPGVVTGLHNKLEKLRRKAQIEIDYKDVFNGEDAIKAIQEKQAKGESFDVIIIDQRMPEGAQGTDVLTYATQHMPDAQQVLYTGQAQYEEVAQSINTTHIDLYQRKNEDPEKVDAHFLAMIEEFKKVDGRKHKRIPIPVLPVTTKKEEDKFKDIALLVLEPTASANQLTTLVKSYVAPYKSKVITSHDLQDINTLTQKVHIIVLDLDFLELSMEEKIKLLEKFKQVFPSVLLLIVSAEITLKQRSDILADLINRLNVNRFSPKPLKKEMISEYLKSLMTSAIKLLENSSQSITTTATDSHTNKPKSRYKLSDLIKKSS